MYGGENDGENGKYKERLLLSGMMVVPCKNGGIRKEEGWDFHYRGWEIGEDMKCKKQMTTKDNMMPDNRKG